MNHALKQVSETLIGMKVGKGYNCLCDLFGFRRSINILQIRRFTLKFSSLHMRKMLQKIFYLKFLPKLYL